MSETWNDRVSQGLLSSLGTDFLLTTRLSRDDLEQRKRGEREVSGLHIVRLVVEVCIRDVVSVRATLVSEQENVLVSMSDQRKL